MGYKLSLLAVREIYFLCYRVSSNRVDVKIKYSGRFRS